VGMCDVPRYSLRWLTTFSNERLVVDQRKKQGCGDARVAVFLSSDETLRLLSGNGSSCFPLVD
jgi:hypothetical protein